MWEQLKYWLADYRRLTGKYKFRALYIWIGRAAIGVSIYRFERGMYLTFGRGWEILRIIFTPIMYPLYAYSNCDINYKADIGPGLKVLHPAVGIVISGKAKIGKNITLTGGNVIGVRPGTNSGDLIIGNNCSMGANAVILGPVKLGNNINVGSLALVLKDCLIEGATLIGVPAKMLNKEENK